MKWLKYGAITFAGIIAIGVIVLHLMSYRAGAGKTTSIIEINRPPAAVWAWLEEKDKFKQWVSWTVDVQDSGPNGVGGKRRTTMKDPNMDNQLVQIDAVTTELVLHKHIKVAITTPMEMGFVGTVAYDLEDLGGRTRLKVDGDFKYTHWFASLLEPIITPSAQAKEDADLATLKRLAEAS